MIAVLLLSTVAQPAIAQSSTSQVAKELRSRWDMEVRWGAAGFGPVLFPLPSSIPAIPLDDGDAPAALEVIRTALSAYSDGYVRDHAAVTVLLCKVLTVDGDTVGGFSRLTEYYLLALDAGTADGSAALRRATDYLMTVPLANERALDRTAWSAVNPPDFQYAAPSPYKDAEIEPLNRLRARPKELYALHAAGLLSPQGKISLWSDVSDFAELAFEQPAELASIARHSPLVKAKVLLLMDAYTTLDAGMADAFARSGLAELRVERP